MFDVRIANVGFTLDGQWVFTDDLDIRSLRLWSLQNPQDVRQIINEACALRSLGISPDGQYLAGGGTANQMQVWDIQGGQQVRSYFVVQQGNLIIPILPLAFSADGRYLLAGNYQIAQLWGFFDQIGEQSFNTRADGRSASRMVSAIRFRRVHSPRTSMHCWRTGHHRLRSHPAHE